MPPRDWRMRITDILEAIAKIEIYTQGMDFEQFASDDKTIDAVVRNITVIGEAARALPAQIVDSHPELPWQDMRDMRNAVVHVYFGIDKRILWDTVQADLQPLIPLLKAMVE